MTGPSKGERLAGKVAVVVGGGSTGEVPGTGAAAAQLFAAQGAKVAVVGRTAEHTDATVSAICLAGGEAIGLLGDAAEPPSCERLIGEVIGQFGRLDVVVNNLGIASPDSVKDITPEVWHDAVAINLTSVVFMSKAAAPHLALAGGGSIVNVGSVSGLQASGAIGYGTTKGALVALTRELALTLGPDKIRVNCVIPGHLYTPMAAFAGEELREVRNRLNMLGVEGSGWDAAWAILFFASEESRFVTATALPVDGGVTGILGFTQYLRTR